MHNFYFEDVLTIIVFLHTEILSSIIFFTLQAVDEFETTKSPVSFGNESNFEENLYTNFSNFRWKEAEDDAFQYYDYNQNYVGSKSHKESDRTINPTKMFDATIVNFI